MAPTGELVSATARGPQALTGSIPRQVLSEVRWSFTRPYAWLAGVAVNLVLSVVWLVVEPLSGEPHRDWAILVGTYFAVFILADVTTTNVLGVDSIRVRLSLLRHVPLGRILLVKNLTLLVIVGLPTLVATAAVTVTSEAGYRLALTLPGVLFPILTWLGVGNVVSVLLPVAATSLRERWRRRRRYGSTVRWLFALGLPYALCLAVDPVGRLPLVVIRHITVLPRTIAVRGGVIAACGLALWSVTTSAALALARVRKIRFDDVR